MEVDIISGLTSTVPHEDDLVAFNIVAHEVDWIISAGLLCLILELDMPQMSKSFARIP
jgi:hypothetical protein